MTINFLERDPFKKVECYMNEVYGKIFNDKFETRGGCEIEYLYTLFERYDDIVSLNVSTFVNGKGYRKRIHQKQYEEMSVT